jgi:hypothetical protein
MATAELRALSPADEAAAAHRPVEAARVKPALPLRPLHVMWRRSIDRVEVTRVALPVRGLPEPLAGLVACQISDLHVDREEDVERLARAVDMINREAPDFIFLTGDYFSGPDMVRRFAGAFRDLIARLTPRQGIFAILGNHDHWASSTRITEALRGAGAEVLANDSRRIEVRGERLLVVGIDDLWSRRAEPARAFRGVRADEPTVVLAHNPDTALYARHLRPGVMLSGHTHGGVVRIPFYGSPLRSILQIGKQYYAGLNRFGDFYIYTNRGLGTFWFRLRVNCRPEISRFTLATLAESAAAPRAEPRRAPTSHHPRHSTPARPRRRRLRRR